VLLGIRFKVDMFICHDKPFLAARQLRGGNPGRRGRPRAGKRRGLPGGPFWDRISG
jgi:hypothetical protein